MITLLRRYDLKPYRYRNQRRTTVMVKDLRGVRRVAVEYLGEDAVRHLVEVRAKRAGDLLELRPEGLNTPPLLSEGAARDKA